MRKIDLTRDEEQEKKGTGKSLPPSTKRLLVILVAVFIVGIGVLAAQKFLLQQQPLPSPPARPATTAPPAPPQASSKPPEVVQPLPAVPPVSVPTPPVSTAKEEEIAEPVEHPKPEAKGKEGERIGSRSTREGYPSPKYSIQVESYSQESNALSLKRRLEQEGFSPRIVQSKMALTRHNVYLGDFSGPEQAAEMGSRLQAEGIRGTLESLEDGRQSYWVGSFYTLAEAVDRALEIQRKNYPVRVVSSTPMRAVYHVRIGHFDDRLRAAKMVARLRGQGHSPIVVKE